ncbi:hypothetical protein AB6D59_12610 [Vibrio cyclitrophicus]
MKDAIASAKTHIEYHQKRVNWLQRGMWGIVILALIAYTIISAMLQYSIDKIMNALAFAATNNLGSIAQAPESMVAAVNDNRLGLIVLLMFASVLLAIFGRLKFHLSQQAMHEQMLYGFLRIEASSNEKLSENAVKALLNNPFSTNQKSEPIINIPTEAITKVVDAVGDRVSSIVKRKET